MPTPTPGRRQPPRQPLCKPLCRPFCQLLPPSRALADVMANAAPATPAAATTDMIFLHDIASPPLQSRAANGRWTKDCNHPPCPLIRNRIPSREATVRTLPAVEPILFATCNDDFPSRAMALITLMVLSSNTRFHLHLILWRDAQ